MFPANISPLTGLGDGMPSYGLHDCLSFTMPRFDPWNLNFP
jgi:hypothetical protein